MALLHLLQALLLTIGAAVAMAAAVSAGLVLLSRLEPSRSDGQPRR
ncbi:MAG TPA: hypothetical protein VKQ71_08615 [Acidimicrobiales bacterium]|nr:hypothetical protein [Acidimicrobiales bacterium]